MHSKVGRWVSSIGRKCKDSDGLPTQIYLCFYPVFFRPTIILALFVLGFSSVHAQNPFGKIAGNMALMVAAKPWLKINSSIAFNQQVLAVGELETPEIVEKAKDRLEKTLHRQLNLRVLRDQEFNAAAYPSGDMFINIGAVQHLRGDEASIAFILGHETAHLDMEHSLQLFRQQLVLDGALQAFVQNNSPYSNAVGLLINISLMKYSRAHELEADRIGFVYAVKAGYDADAPAHALEAMDEMHRDQPSLGLGFLASHPATPERVRRLHEYAAAYRAGVPLKAIQEGRLINGIEREIGKEPDVNVSASPFIDLLMNCPKISYKKGERPDIPTVAYKKSEHPRFAIKLKTDGYLTILSRNPSGEVNSLLPNRYQPSGEVHTGETVQLPSPEYHHPGADFVRLTWDKKGDYYLIFILTEQNWDASTVLHTKMEAEGVKQAIEKAVSASGGVPIEIHEQPITVGR